MRRIFLPSIFIPILFILSPQTHADSKDKIFGLEPLGEKIKVAQPDVQNSQPGITSHHNCYVFKNFIAVELEVGDKGAGAITVRPRKAKQNIKDICAAHSWPGELKVPDNEQYVLGAKSKFLFTISADEFGDLGGIWIYDIKSGKQLFQADYSLSQSFTVSQNGDKISLDYYSRLPLKCSLKTPSNSCWADTVRENFIPKSVQIKEPDCSNVFSRADFKNNPTLANDPQAIQVFTHVKVADISTAKLSYLGGTALRNATP